MTNTGSIIDLDGVVNDTIAHWLDVYNQREEPRKRPSRSSLQQEHSTISSPF
jgi:hypothetical protein